MKADTIFRKLREFDVPSDKAREVADRHGDDTASPSPAHAQLQAMATAARRKFVEQHRREFRAWCRVNGLSNPTHEYSFARKSHRRGWRFDWAWPDADGDGGVALEIDGGAWTQGRHTRGKGFIEDQEKRAAAVTLGWRMLNVTPQTLYTDSTAENLRTLLNVSDEAAA